MGKNQMPPKSHLYFTRHKGDLRTMPAYLEGLYPAGVKIVTTTPSPFEEDEIHAELGEILVGKKPGRVSEEEITLFDSTARNPGCGSRPCRL